MLLSSDNEFLETAISIAIDSIDRGGGPFGAVIVKNGEIIARAHNEVTLTNDPTAHAEVRAIQKASAFLQSFSLHDCVLYSSCEPCPMCLGAIYWAKIPKVIFAASRIEAAHAGFDDNFIYQQLQLPLQQRSMITIHAPLDSATQVFEKWQKTDNKLEY